MQRSTNYRPKKENLKKYRVNREIRSNSVRVIIGRKDSDSQLLDVRDAMRAYWEAIMYCEYGEVYNIGGTTSIKVAEFLEKLISMI